MEFKLKISMDNEAFSDGEFELVRILKNVTSYIEKNGVKVDHEALRDYNGNTVGYWIIEDSE
jgi:hypothetical protein